MSMISELVEELIDNADLHTKELHDLMYRAAETIEMLSEKAREPMEWIPCSERLPEEHEWIGTKAFNTTISDEVIVTFDVNGTRFVRVLSLQNGQLSSGDKKRMDVFHKGWKMLAWMPLPEPCMRGEKNNG